MKAFLKNWVPLILFLLGGFLILLYGWISVREEYGYQIYWNADEQFTEPLTNENRYETSFAAPGDMRLSGVMIELASDHLTEGPGRVRLSISSSPDTAPLEGEIIAAEILEYGWQEVSFEPTAVSAGDEITIRIEPEDFPEGNTIALVKSLDQYTPALKIRTTLLDRLQKTQIVFAGILLAWVVTAYLLLFRMKKNPLWVLGISAGLFILCFCFLIPEHDIYDAFYSAVKTGGISVLSLELLASALSRIPMFLWVVLGIDLSIGVISLLPVFLVDDRDEIRRKSMMGSAFLLIPFVTALFISMQ